MSLSTFLSGIYMMGFVGSGLFFYKFYRASRDSFFRLFAYACWILALERVALLFVDHPFSSVASDMRGESWIYVIRLVGFAIILYAIIQKNRRRQ